MGNPFVLLALATLPHWKKYITQVEKVQVEKTREVAAQPVLRVDQRHLVQRAVDGLQRCRSPIDSEQITHKRNTSITNRSWASAVPSTMPQSADEVLQQRDVLVGGRPGPCSRRRQTGDEHW